MTTATHTHEAPLTARREWPRARLVRAELLKLRRRRGLLAFTALATIAPVVIGYGITIFLHIQDPAGNGPAGGIENYSGGLGVLDLLAGVAAVVVGATLGAGDFSSGVFRDLVVTGRSRTALFTARIPAGLAQVWALTGVGFAVATLVSVALAGSRPAPSAALIAWSGLWIAISVTSAFLLSLGISSAFGSRSMSIGILLGWQLALAKLLMALSFLGVVREGLVSAAVASFVPDELKLGTPVTDGRVTAVIVVIAWPVAALAIGAWRTASRDA
jgi:hypothetical protein